MFKRSNKARAKKALISILTANLLLSACGSDTTAIQHTPTFIETGLPALLSDWDVVYAENGVMSMSEGVLPYDLNSALFTDYAHKLRTVWMPKGVSANYTPNDALNFPVGTIISKTFYYPRVEGEAMDSMAVLKTDDYTRDMKNGGLDLAAVRLVETRVIVHRQDGWVALPYVWNEAQTEARLKRTGDIQKLELVDQVAGTQASFPYVVPNSNQCAGCHGTDSVTRNIMPIGPKARHLNKNYTYAGTMQNQLVKLQEVGYLTGLPAMETVAKSAVWDDETLSLSERARAYLDINCSHCHSTVGPADTSGLHFEPQTEFGSYLGVCKISVSAGAGTGGFLFDINPGQADRSIMTFRMKSTNPGTMMPELGRSTVHTEGVALMDAWINQLDGACEK